MNSLAWSECPLVEWVWKCGLARDPEVRRKGNPLCPLTGVARGGRRVNSVTPPCAEVHASDFTGTEEMLRAAFTYSKCSSIVIH